MVSVAATGTVTAVNWESNGNRTSRWEEFRFLWFEFENVGVDMVLHGDESLQFDVIVIGFLAFLRGWYFFRCRSWWQGLEYDEILQFVDWMRQLSISFCELFLRSVLDLKSLNRKTAHKSTHLVRFSLTVIGRDSPEWNCMLLGTPRCPVVAITYCTRCASYPVWMD